VSERLKKIGWNRLTPQERLEARIEKRGANECWPYRGCRSTDGYGSFANRKLTTHAHRAAWIFWRGAIPNQLFVLHKCDNRLCCNLNHLFLGTNAANMADMKAKVRRKNIGCGEENGRAILTASKVREIRKRYDHGEISLKSLSEEFKSNPSTIYHVTRRFTWIGAQFEPSL